MNKLDNLLNELRESAGLINEGKIYGDIRAAYALLKKHAHMPPLSIERYGRHLLGIKDKQGEWVKDGRDPVLFRNERDAKRFHIRAEILAREAYMPREDEKTPAPIGKGGMFSLQAIREAAGLDLVEGHGNQMIILKTRKPDERQLRIIIQGFDGPYHLRDEFGVTKFKTLDKLFLQLGGMVDWDHWSKKSQEWIRSMNKGKII